MVVSGENSKLQLRNQQLMSQYADSAEAQSMLRAVAEVRQGEQDTLTDRSAELELMLSTAHEQHRVEQMDLTDRLSSALVCTKLPLMVSARASPN